MIRDLVKGGQDLVTKNAPVILTGVGVAGTVATAVLTGRATYQAVQAVLENENREGEDREMPQSGLNKTEIVKLTWHYYIPPVAIGVGTIGAIIMSHRIDAKRAAALAAAYGLAQREFQDYKDKVTEKLGSKQDEKVRDAVAQDRVDKNPMDDRQIIIVGNSEVTCYDQFTGRYFPCTAERIKQAENALNYEINQRLYASLRFFYDEIGLEPTDAADILGWRNGDNPTVKLSATLDKNSKPVLVMSFDMMPYPEYNNHSY